MKTNLSFLHMAAAVFAGIISAYAADTVKGPRVDPATGLVAYNNATDSAGAAAHIDPATGLRVPNASGLLRPDEMVNLAFSTDREVRPLILNGRYEEALQRYLVFHQRVKANVSLSFVLSGWVELGRRYPKAKVALLEIRDRDVLEFSEGRGYFELFQELASINQQYGNDEATYALFKTTRENDPKLARECLFCIDGLVAEKEGTPQERFALILRDFERQRENRESLAARNRQTADMMAKRGLKHSSGSIDTSAIMKKYAENRFVEQTSHLIENLVATGLRAEAEKIRAQSLAVLDDARLKAVGTAAAQKPD